MEFIIFYMQVYLFKKYRSNKIDRNFFWEKPAKCLRIFIILNILKNTISEFLIEIMLRSRVESFFENNFETFPDNKHP